MASTPQYSRARCPLKSPATSKSATKSKHGKMSAPRKTPSKKPKPTYYDLTADDDDEVVVISSGSKSATKITTQESLSKKRKATDFDLNSEEENEIAAAVSQNELAGIFSSQGSKKSPRKPKEEKRLKRFRSTAPRTYLDRLERVRSQRMFLIDRDRKQSEDGSHEEEVFDLAGTTGNIYQVTIGRVPSCTCPDSAKGNQCKHIIYVLVNVLKARSDLAYQLAFLTTELHEIFSSAPPAPQSTPSSTLSTDTGGSRKPIEGDCPVCVMEFSPSDPESSIIWCKAACGQNIHRMCFEQWAKSKPGQVKCVYCRSPWKGDEKTLSKINKGGKVGADGYVNVASELGISGHRDMSTYHQPWVRMQGYGGYDYDADDGY